MNRRQALGPKPTELNPDGRERLKLEMLVRGRRLLGSPVRVRARAILALVATPA
jgi:hypothetical protein